MRVVAATNAPLERLVAEGRFREDLFYRLNVVRLPVPPLRERREEIPLLVRALADRLPAKDSASRCASPTTRWSSLTIFPWPGNTRQLVNELRRLMAFTEPGAVVMCRPPRLGDRRIRRSRANVAGDGGSVKVSDPIQPLAAALEHVERKFIAQALERANGNVERAAQSLGLSRKGLFLKRQRLGLP